MSIHLAHSLDTIKTSDVMSYAAHNLSHNSHRIVFIISNVMKHLLIKCFAFTKQQSVHTYIHLFTQVGGLRSAVEYYVIKAP